MHARSLVSVGGRSVLFTETPPQNIRARDGERERENMNGKKLNKIKLLLGLEDNILTQSIITIDANISALCSWLLPLANRLHPMMI